MILIAKHFIYTHNESLALKIYLVGSHLMTLYLQKLSMHHVEVDFRAFLHSNNGKQEFGLDPICTVSDLHVAGKTFSWTLVNTVVNFSFSYNGDQYTNTFQQRILQQIINNYCSTGVYHLLTKPRSRW